MRQEYNMSGMTSLIDAIKDFLSNFSSLYTLIVDDGINLVYHVNNYDIDLVFTKSTYERTFLSCFLVKAFTGSGSTWFVHADNLVKWVGDPVQYDTYNDHPGTLWKIAVPVYYPCVVLVPASNGVLVANYNSMNDTIMFSIINKAPFNLSGVDSFNYVTSTNSLIISDSEKYLDFDGGFFIGGTHCGCMEYCVQKEYHCNIIDGAHNHDWLFEGTADYFVADSHANCAYFHVQPRPRCYTGRWVNPWVDRPYITYNNRVRNDTQNISRNMPDITNYIAFDIIMYGKIDNAPYRNRGEFAHDISTSSGWPSYAPYEAIKDLDNYVNLRRYADWCTSCQPNPILYDTWTDGGEGRIGYFYPIAVPSITNSTIKVPRYEPLLSDNMLDNGHNVNILNNISMVMPLYISVRRDPPEDELSYSAVCRNDVINFVNMRYMSTNKMTNGIYPVEEHTYNCFNIGGRRNTSGFKGYQGIAFRQEDEE